MSEQAAENSKQQPSQTEKPHYTTDKVKLGKRKRAAVGASTKTSKEKKTNEFKWTAWKKPLQIMAGICLALAVGITLNYKGPWLAADMGTKAALEPVMVEIPGGSFRMGCISGKGCEDDEKPPHKVTLSSFRMSKYEVTIGQYLKFSDETGTHPPEWLKPGSQYHIETGSDDRYKNRGVSRKNSSNPIMGVSWDDAVAYAKWLSKRRGNSSDCPLKRSGSTPPVQAPQGRSVLVARSA